MVPCYIKLQKLENYIFCLYVYGNVCLICCRIQIHRRTFYKITCKITEWEDNLPACALTEPGSIESSIWVWKSHTLQGVHVTVIASYNKIIHNFHENLLIMPPTWCGKLTLELHSVFLENASDSYIQLCQVMIGCSFITMPNNMNFYDNTRQWWEGNLHIHVLQSSLSNDNPDASTPCHL